MTIVSGAAVISFLVQSSLDRLRSPVILHRDEELAHVGEPQRLVVRALMFAKRTKLPGRNLVSLKAGVGGMECPHVSHKGARGGRRYLDWLAGHGWCYGFSDQRAS